MAVRVWTGVPRYAHLLIDQTRVAPEQMRGDLHGRSVQHALLAAYRKSWPILQRLVPLLAELGRAGRVEDVGQIVVYIATTMREKKRWQRFADAVRRQVPGGEELMNEATAEMLQIYREVKEQEVRQEGELRRKLQVIKGLLDRDVPWSTIAAATGIDQTRFRQLKQQLEAAPDGLSSSN